MPRCRQKHRELCGLRGPSRHTCKPLVKVLDHSSVSAFDGLWGISLSQKCLMCGSCTVSCKVH
jgi:hypothetical protein